MRSISECGIGSRNEGVLWPLFHYRENFDYEDAWYDHYVTANQLFADAVAKVRRMTCSEHIIDGSSAGHSPLHFLATASFFCRCGRPRTWCGCTTTT